MSPRLMPARARAPLVAAALLIAPLLPAPAARGQATEQQSLTDAAGAPSEYFGSSVATQGDLLVVGAPDDGTKAYQAGAALVYRFDAAARAWNLEQELFASDYAYAAWFGSAVAIDGDAIVVGAPGESTGLGAYSGEAYVFRYDAGSGQWHEEQKLVSSVGAANDSFGNAVAIDGDVTVVGAFHADVSGKSDAGAAVVFRRDATSGQWNEEAQLVEPTPGILDLTGYSVGVDGATIVVGAPNGDWGGWLDPGAVHVFTWDGTAWSHAAEIDNTGSHSHYPSDDHFGRACAIHGGTIAVGAYAEDYFNTIGDSGWIHVYSGAGSSWAKVADISNPDPHSYDYFGWTVAMTDNEILVGEPSGDTNGLADSGSVWLFRRGNQSGWVLDGQLVASDGAAGDRLGDGIAVSKEHVVAGAPRYDTALGSDAGAVYVYDGDAINLVITPPDPAPGQLVTFQAYRGAAGSLGLVAITDVAGSPFFLPVLITTFAADDTITFSANAPNPALGIQVGLRAFKTSPTGGVAASATATVDL